MRIIKKRHPPGTAPGTLPTPAATVEPARARVISYDASEITDTNLLDEEGLDLVPAGRTAWLDIEGHDVGLIAALGRRLEVHPLALEDVLHVGQRPKVEDYEDSLFLVIDHFSSSDGGDLMVEQVSLVVQENLVVSVRERESGLFAPVLQRLEGGKGRIREGGAGYLAYALIDTVVDNVFPVLERIGNRLETLEASILDDPTDDDLNSLHEVKRELLLLRKSMWPARDMLRNRLLVESPLFSRETQLFIRDAADHATNAVEIIETYREMVSSLNDLYLTNISIRANEIMKVLTIIATIFIPLSFIAGLYGMNFNPGASPWNMPELNWYWGYPAALVLMGLVAGGLLLFIWRRKWL
ncbi:MAG TPA: magnesium/cobalt transporter CorA [Chondromyces sp.]|nr:magnesium/cobalt transporter CorA [Chondromyces sp.]